MSESYFTRDDWGNHTINWKDLDICPACIGTGELEFDNGYDEDGHEIIGLYFMKCPRCVVNRGKYTQPLEVMEQLGKTVYKETEPDNG